MLRIIKRFIKRIKNIFKHKHSEDNVLNKYYKLDKDVFCSEQQQKIFDNAKVGDFIFSTMPLDKEELKRVPVGHQQRPYYVAYKLNNGFIAFYATSTKIVKKSLNYYVVDNYKYSSLNKYTYIDLSRVEYIPKNNINFMMFSLDIDDIYEINRRLYATSRKKFLQINQNEIEKYVARVGDIFVYDNKLWLAINEDNNKYETINVSINNKTGIFDKYTFKCNKCEYILHCDIRRNISKQPTIIPYDIVDKSSFNKILKIINENNISFESLKEGHIFEMNNNLYYCKNKNEYNASAYRVYAICDDNNTSMYDCFDYQDKKYYIESNRQYTIPPSVTVKTLLVLDIKNEDLTNKKTNNKKKKANKENKYYSRMKIGTILSNTRDEYYVYMYSDDMCDYGVSVYEYENNDVYQDYSLYSLGKDKTIEIGEADDDALSDILYEQISKGRDKQKILNTKYQELISNHVEDQVRM